MKWVIDPTQTPVLNRAFRDWNADFFALLKASGMAAVCSFSQELVNPPDNPPASVWVQRFPDGSLVETATGFGTLNSSQIAFSAGPQSYLAQAHAAMAGLMQAAGLTPQLQFGEILWWFLANASGMAFYDADTQAAAQTALGRPLATFHTPNDDPSINSYADANLLRTRLYNYVAAIQSAVLAQCSSAVFELLWPMDVNDPDNCKLLRYITLKTEAESIRVWTIQRPLWWCALQKRGEIRGDGRHACQSFRPAYKWMMEQMRRRVPGYGGGFPIWLWHSPKPELRHSGHLALGEQALRIELELPREIVLLSDFETWHCVLNRWHLSLTRRESRGWDRRTKDYDQFRHTLPAPLEAELRTTWERVFDLDLVHRTKLWGPVDHVADLTGCSARTAPARKQ